MADNLFNFDVDGLKVSLTMGTLKGTKKFKNQKELDAAKVLFDNTVKAIKAKKGAASLKAELFTLFGIDYSVVPKSADKGAASTDVAPTKAEKPAKETKTKAKAKEEPAKAETKATKGGQKVNKTSGSASGQKVAAPTKEEAPKQKTTFVQVGSTVTAVIDGKKLSKKFKDKTNVEPLVTIFKKIEKYEAADKMSAAQLLSYGKLKTELGNLLQSETIKQEKEKEEADTKLKAIDKQMKKLKKEPNAKVVTPNKDIAQTLKEAGHELDDEQVQGIKDAIEKKKKVEPAAVAAPTRRRGEH